MDTLRSGAALIRRAADIRLPFGSYSSSELKQMRFIHSQYSRVGGEIPAVLRMNDAFTFPLAKIQEAELNESIWMNRLGEGGRAGSGLLFKHCRAIIEYTCRYQSSRRKRMMMERGHLNDPTNLVLQEIRLWVVSHLSKNAHGECTEEFLALLTKRHRYVESLIDMEIFPPGRNSELTMISTLSKLRTQLKECINKIQTQIAGATIHQRIRGLSRDIEAVLHATIQYLCLALRDTPDIPPSISLLELQRWCHSRLQKQANHNITQTDYQYHSDKYTKGGGFEAATLLLRDLMESPGILGLIPGHAQPPPPPPPPTKLQAQQKQQRPPTKHQKPDTTTHRHWTRSEPKKRGGGSPSTLSSSSSLSKEPEPKSEPKPEPEEAADWVDVKLVPEHFSSKSGSGLGSGAGFGSASKRPENGMTYFERDPSFERVVGGYGVLSRFRRDVSVLESFVSVHSGVERLGELMSALKTAEVVSALGGQILLVGSASLELDRVLWSVESVLIFVTERVCYLDSVTDTHFDCLISDTKRKAKRKATRNNRTTTTWQQTMSAFGHVDEAASEASWVRNHTKVLPVRWQLHDALKHSKKSLHDLFSQVRVRGTLKQQIQEAKRETKGFIHNASRAVQSVENLLGPTRTTLPPVMQLMQRQAMPMQPMPMQPMPMQPPNLLPPPPQKYTPAPPPYPPPQHVIAKSTAKKKFGNVNVNINQNSKPSDNRNRKYSNISSTTSNISSTTSEITMLSTTSASEIASISRSEIASISSHDIASISENRTRSSISTDITPDITADITGEEMIPSKHQIITNKNTTSNQTTITTHTTQQTNTHHLSRQQHTDNSNNTADTCTDTCTGTCTDTCTDTCVDSNTSQHNVDSNTSQHNSRQQHRKVAVLQREITSLEDKRRQEHDYTNTQDHDYTNTQDRTAVNTQDRTAVLQTRDPAAAVKDAMATLHHIM